MQFPDTRRTLRPRRGRFRDGTQTGRTILEENRHGQIGLKQVAGSSDGRSLGESGRIVPG